MADVSLKDLHKVFDRTEAVCGINLEIAMWVKKIVPIEKPP